MAGIDPAADRAQQQILAQQRAQAEAAQRAQAAPPTVVAAPAPLPPSNPIPANTFSAQVAGVQPKLTAQDGLPSDLDLAYMAKDSYTDSNDATHQAVDQAGWAPLTPVKVGDKNQLQGPQGQVYDIDPASLHDRFTGLDAAIYVNKTDPSKVVVAFAGTDPGQMGDLSADARQAYGLDSQQYNQADTLAHKVVDTFGPGQVVFTGHSLGGGIASYAALSTDSAAVTFNASGLSEGSLDKLGMPPGTREALVDNGQIRRYVVEGDQLTGGQQGNTTPDTQNSEMNQNLGGLLTFARGAPDAVGREYLLDDPHVAGTAQHSSFIEALQGDQTPTFVPPADGFLDKTADFLSKNFLFDEIEPLAVGATDLLTDIDYELHGDDGIVNNTVELATGIKNEAVDAYNGVVSDIDYELHGEDGIVNNTVQLATGIKNEAVDAYNGVVSDIDYELHGEDGIVNNTKEFVSNVGGFFGSLLPG